MNSDRFLELAVIIAGLVGTWAVMKYKLDSYGRQLEKIWDWKDRHEDEASKERLTLHSNIAKLQGAWEATTAALNHLGTQATSIMESIKSMQQDLADLKAEKRARDK